MNKPIKPNITIPESFAKNGVKTDFDSDLIASGFDDLKPDVLAGDNLNKFIDDTYQGLNYGMAAADAINLINEGETLTVVDGKLTSGASGGGLEIGDIGIAPLGIDETKGKRRYLNGQIIIQDQYAQFTNKVKSAIALYPSLACTESEWQTTATMTVGGQVGKFVVDDEAGTIRLPKIIMPIQGLTDLSKLGEIVEAGLPTHTHTRGTMDITGQLNSEIAMVGSTASGAFSITRGSYTRNPGSGSTDLTSYTLKLKASDSWTGSTSAPNNATYGKSNTVQQEQIQYPYFIQVATGAETEDNITNTIELNNPFSLLEAKWSDKLLNNISWLRSEGQSNSSIDYADAYNLILTEYNSGTDETETVEGISITFRRGSTTGMKVTIDKSAYDSILSATGTAWYFVLDKANSAFYLPQTNGFFQFGGSGEFVEAGLPNITGSVRSKHGYITTGTGAFTALTSDNDWQGTGTIEALATFDFDASRSNPIYGNSDTVQPNAVKGYLYFYVGETVQNANLINAGRIEEKVASLIPDNSSLISGYGMPSNKYIDLTLGASGTSYTAPANGWVFISANVSQAGGYVQIYKNIYSALQRVVTADTTAICMMPVKKGEAYNMYYTSITKTNMFRFIYAEGEQ